MIKIKKIEYFLCCLVFSLLMLHVLRNLTQAYIVILFLLIFALILVWVKNVNLYLPKIVIYIFFIYFYITIISIITNLNNVGLGLFRLWASFPIICLSLYFAKNFYKTGIWIIFAIGVLSAISLFWQFEFGPISFLAEYSYRDDNIRYSSLAGSLTSYGALVGYWIVLTFYLRPRFLWLYIFIMVLAAILSLQKAALLNVFLGLFFSFKLININRKNVFLIITFFLIILFFINYLNTNFITYLNYFFDQIKGGGLSGDVSILNSFIERVIHYPSISFNYHSLQSMYIGSGVFGASGVLGYPDIPMAHNGFAELLLILGIPLGSISILFLIFIFIYSFFNLIKFSNISKNNLTSSIILFIFIPNYFFAGGALFHPISSAIFWISCFTLFYKREENANFTL